MAVLLTGSKGPRARAGRRRPPACRHCGAPLADAAAAASGFCCAGCAVVYRLIHEQGLEGFYRIKDPVTVPADAAVLEPRDYGWLEQAGREAEARAAARGKGPEIELDVQGISCAGCVWLIERLTAAQAGTREIVTDAARGSLRLRWTPGVFEPAAWARRLQAVGYLVGPAGARPERLESEALVRRIGLCAAFALNVMLFTLPSYFGMRADFAYAGLFRVLALAFATLSVLVGGGYFFSRAAAAVRAGAAHIDLPIALGIGGAYLASLYGWVAGRPGLLYFDFVATFTVLMLAGRWAQVAAVERNRRRLLGRQPVPPRVRLDGGETVPRERVAAGMVLRVGPGQTLPVDGRLEAEAAQFSLASISGEAEPRVMSAGALVPGGAVNVGRTEARVRAAQAWDASLMKQLLSVGEERAAATGLERVVQGYVAGILGLSWLAGAGWWLLGRDPARAGAVAIAVLVVSCPCAIGLALPLADEMAAGAARSRGVFVRRGDVWGRLARVRKIVFDKTGTLTLETPVLLNPEALRGLDAEQSAALGALVQSSLHPVSQCLWESLLAEGSVVPLPGIPEEAPGFGVRLGPWSLGRAGWAAAEPAVAAGATVFARDGVEVARFRFVDAPRPGAAEEMRRLSRLGYDIFIISGDAPANVARVAQQLGIPPERAVGGLSPTGKAEWMDRHAGRDALMLGDGANDSLAFDGALCRGTPVVHRGILESKADFYYLRRGVEGIRGLLAINRVRRRTATVVLGFSVAYNAAAAGFAVAGCVTPLLAAILMPLSSLASLLIVGAGMSRIIGRADDADSR